MAFLGKDASTNPSQNPTPLQLSPRIHEAKAWLDLKDKDGAVFPPALLLIACFENGEVKKDSWGRSQDQHIREKKKNGSELAAVIAICRD